MTLDMKRLEKRLSLEGGKDASRINSSNEGLGSGSKISWS